MGDGLGIRGLLTASFTGRLPAAATGAGVRRRPAGIGRTRDARPIAHARSARPRFVTDLAAFVRFPSVSAQPRHADDLRRCAAWLADHLRSIGLEHVRVVATRRHPIVTADWLHAPGAPTVLVYGHYDVQPADPLDEWTSPPFEPALRDGCLHGRGAADDKGQMFVHVKALECWLRATGTLPVNVKCLFEGEEEIGSANLADFLADDADAWQADAAVMSDMTMLDRSRPRSPNRCAAPSASSWNAADSGRTCIPAISAARSIIRCRRFARSSPRLHDAERHGRDPALLRAGAAADARATGLHGPCRTIG